MLPDLLLVAGPSALPLLVELGAAAAVTVALVLRGALRRFAGRAAATITRRRAAARARAA